VQNAEVVQKLGLLKAEVEQCQTSDTATAIAKVAVSLKKIMGGVKDASKIEIVKRVPVNPDAVSLTNEQSAKMGALRNVAKLVLDEAESFVANEKRILGKAQDLQSIVEVGRSLSCIRKVLDGYFD